MELFRLSRAAFAEPLSGKGAALKGGRWNSVGVELIYTASNRSLAMAEVAVHFSLATLPPDYVMMTIYVPDELKQEQLAATDLPQDWRQFPHPVSTQQFGDRFVLAGQSPLLRVPSAVTQGDFNILINPGHPDFSRIRVLEIVPFPFDNRILR